MSKNKTTVIILLIIALLIIIVPVITMKGAEFGGEMPGELESLMFCVQTGIGVGIMAFIMGRFVERKKWLDKENTL